MFLKYNIYQNKHFKKIIKASSHHFGIT